MRQSIGYKVSKKQEESASEESGELKDSLEKQDESVTVRKIKNGYIVHRSWSEGEGEKKRYKDEDEFYSTNPIA